MEVSAASVKELREKTGAGFVDCKKALEETNGDIEKAVDFLRQKGLSAAAKSPEGSHLKVLLAHTSTEAGRSGF